jgi:fused signal recognition particle receptor
MTHSSSDQKRGLFQRLFSSNHPASEIEAPATSSLSWWQRLKGGLQRSSQALGQGISDLLTKKRLDETTLQDFEDILIRADLGLTVSERIVAALRREKFDRDVEEADIEAVLIKEIKQVLKPVAVPLVINTDKKPFVILMAGVNGAGKTTTIGKLTAKFKKDNYKILLVAGDTFRAAAIEQLQVWGKRTDTEVMSRQQGADAAGLAFDALNRAREENFDIVMIDTAGRLQNRTELMQELEKIVRVIKKSDPEAPHASLLVLDATVGQNALSQVELFRKSAGISGLIMTKLDGTARGGILVALAQAHQIPIHFIGVGEGIDDLEPFTADDFARALTERS